MNPYILILFYSDTGSVANMADAIATGVESVTGIDAKIRAAAPVSVNHEATAAAHPEHGAPYATLDDLANCHGLALGSATRFGNIAAPLQHYLDQTASIWQSGGLINKPAGCFTSTASLHGGQESTLLHMMTPLLHHGAVIVGVPYSETALFSTTAGGTPYGPSHVAGGDNNTVLTNEERQICHTFGQRLATLAKQLA